MFISGIQVEELTIRRLNKVVVTFVFALLCGLVSREAFANGSAGVTGLKLKAAKGRMLQVVGVLPNTPAAMVGIKKGDKIVAIDEVPLTNMTLKQAVSKLRGAPGTRLTLEILRQEKAPFQVSLVRAVPTTSTKTSSTGAAPAKTTKTSTTPSKEPTGSETTEQMF